MVPEHKLTRWFWIRHAPAIDPEGRLYGQRDVDCDCSNHLAFAALAAELPDDAVWLVTPLQRTRKTAAAIQAAGRRGPVPIVEPLLMEQNFGAWQGQIRSEVTRHRLWIAAPDARAPGGESFVEVYARCRAAIERWTAECKGRNIIVVAHGGTIRSALGVALNLPAETALAFSCENLSLTVIEHFETPARAHDWRVSAVNRVPARLYATAIGHGASGSTGL
jgi:alpha-ribazole phosphatase